MNKQIIIPAFILFIGLVSCTDKRIKQQQELEKDYATLFEKEYAEFAKSDLYKQYEERYNELCAISDRIYLSDSMLIEESIVPKDSLCFEGNEELEWEMESKRNDDYTNGIIKIYPYSEYINTNGPINAVIVNSEFCRGANESGNFSVEDDLHQAFNALNKEKFLAQCKEIDTLPSYIYAEFCKARLNMDKLLHSKYFLVLKKTLHTKWEYNASTNEDFMPALYMATVYVYNVEQKKVQYDLNIFAMNSETVQGTESAMESAFRSDLNSNMENALKQSLDSLIGVKGEVTSFYMAFP